MVQPLTAPRWEWRTFNPPKKADALILDMTHAVPYSHETSFIRLSSDVDARVHDGVLEVKMCLRVDERGAEEWVPVAKTAFPIGADAMSELFAAWQHRAPALEPQYREAAFRAAFAGDSDVLTVDLFKERRVAVVDGCLVERAVFALHGARVVTIAVIAQDPEALWRTVRALGLASAPTVNYVSALRERALAAA